MLGIGGTLDSRYRRCYFMHMVRSLLVSLTLVVVSGVAADQNQNLVFIVATTAKLTGAKALGGLDGTSCLPTLLSQTDAQKKKREKGIQWRA